MRMSGAASSIAESMAIPPIASTFAAFPAPGAPGLGLCFFSSRKRHTRYWRDWSSDVSSSDLRALDPAAVVHQRDRPPLHGEGVAVLVEDRRLHHRRPGVDAQVRPLPVARHRHDPLLTLCP